MRKLFVFSAILATLLVCSPYAKAQSMKIKTENPVDTYQVGDIITFGVYIDLSDVSGGDDAFSWQFSLGFDGAELEWVNYLSDDRDSNLTLYIPSDWVAYTLGAPLYEYTGPPETWNFGANTLVMVNAAKSLSVTAQNWHMEGEVKLADFDLRLKDLLPKDGAFDVWTFRSDAVGESFGFSSSASPVVVGMSTEPDGAPDFGVAAVPEPVSMLLFAVGCGFLNYFRKNK